MDGQKGYVSSVTSSTIKIVYLEYCISLAFFEN